MGQNPGGVSGDLRLWLKADKEASSSAWNDQSPNNYDFNNPTGSPALISDVLNFNPVMRFDGNDFMRSTANNQSFPEAQQERTVFSVISNPTSGKKMVFHYGTDGGGVANTVYGQLITSSNTYGADYGGSTIGTNLSRTTDPVVFMTSYKYNNPASILQTVRTNYNTGANSGTPPITQNNSTNATIGASSNGSFRFNGDIAEIIVYRDILTSMEELRVSSYLALKYGLTLASGATDYLASDGTDKIWDKDASGASTYKQDIAGIGRDNNSGLGQVKSQSQNSDAILTIEAEGEGTNASPAFSDISNLEFFSWANDGGALTETSSEVFGAITKRLGREWLIQETGDVGNLSLSFDISQSGLTGKVLADFKLAVDDDDDFSNGITSLISATSFVGDIVTFSGVNLDDGDYITLSTESALLKFTVQPSNTVNGTSFSPAIEVSFVNGADDVITTISASISLFILNNPGSGTLGGTSTVAASSGVATFSDISINKVGQGYTLVAYSPDFPVDVSVAFDITAGPPDRFEFLTEPIDTKSGSNLSPAVRVAVMDANGNIVTTDTRSIDLGLSTNPTAATLSGTLMVNTVDGIATFNDISIDKIGTGYILEASAWSLTSAFSSTFDILGAPGGVDDELRYWLDAADLDGDGLNEGVAGESGQSGSEIATWSGKAGGVDFTNDAGLVTGTTPNLKEAQVNFNEAVAFNESVTTDYLGVSAANFPTTGITQFLIAKTTTSGEGLFSYASQAGSTNEFLIFSQGNVWFFAAGANQSGTGVTFNDGQPTIVAVERTSSSGSVSFHVNGKLQTIPAVAPGENLEAAGVIILAQEQDVVGGGFDPNQAYEGDLAEVITYAKVLGSNERQRVESYLALKYGISLDQTSPTDYLDSMER